MRQKFKIIAAINTRRVSDDGSGSRHPSSPQRNRIENMTLSSNQQITPSYAVELARVFGPPSQSAFGSSVFFIPAAEQSASLEADANAKYRFFLGDSWERLGEQNWIDGWGEVYKRERGSSTGILAELQSLQDRAARQSAGLMLENQEDPETANKALVDAFDNAHVVELSIFKVGDGSAMSGIFVAAKITEAGSLFLILLLD